MTVIFSLRHAVKISKGNLTVVGDKGKSDLLSSSSSHLESSSDCFFCSSKRLRIISCCCLCFSRISLSSLSFSNLMFCSFTPWMEERGSMHEDRRLYAIPNADNRNILIISVLFLLFHVITSLFQGVGEKEGGKRKREKERQKKSWRKRGRKRKRGRGRKKGRRNRNRGRKRVGMR